MCRVGSERHMRRTMGGGYVMWRTMYGGYRGICGESLLSKGTEAYAVSLSKAYAPWGLSWSLSWSQVHVSFSVSSASIFVALKCIYKPKGDRARLDQKWLRD